MKTLVVIVNYRTGGLTVECLRSLAPEMDDQTRVVVTDNASGDDSVETIARAIEGNGWQHWCTLMPLPENGGFSYGNNQAIRRALDHTHSGPLPNPPPGYRERGPEYVYLLNPDTTVFPGVLRELVSFMDTNPRCGIAGSRAENRDGTVRKSAFRFHSIAGEIERQAELGIVSGILRSRAVGLPIPGRATRVDWVSGCGMMVRREVFETIGLLDENYFMYFEESDFALRAHRAGFDCWYVPTSRLIHFVGQSSGVTGADRAKKRRPMYWFESRYHYFNKNHGWLYAQLANAAWIVAYSFCLLKRKVTGKDNPDPPKLWRDFVRSNFWFGSSTKDAVVNSGTTPTPENTTQSFRATASAVEKPHAKLVLGTTNQNPPDISFWQLVKEDLRTHEGDLFSQGFWALFQHRLGNWRMGLPKLLRPPFTLLYRFLHKWVQWTCGISLAYTVKVGRRVHIWHFGGMVLGAREIGDDVHIRQNTTFGVARRGDSPLLKPTFEDRVDIGAGAVVCGGIRIGHDSVIGANAVVLKDVPPYSVVVGIPGKVIKTLEPKEEKPSPQTFAAPIPRDEAA